MWDGNWLVGGNPWVSRQEQPSSHDHGSGETCVTFDSDNETGRYYSFRLITSVVIDVTPFVRLERIFEPEL